MRETPLTNRAVKHVTRFLAPGILATVAAFWAVGQAGGAEVQLTQISKNAVEITGGSGKEAWRLRYGLVFGGDFKPRLVVGEGNRAWYSDGGWLREIDTQKGVVIGRWHYPGEIVNVIPQGMKVQIEIQERMSLERTYHRKLQLDPNDPRVPYWPTNWLMLYRVSINEGQMVWPSAINNGAPNKIPSEEAKRILPELEDAVRRDPYTPWFRVGLGKVLRDLGDPRAAEEFQAAIKSPGTDFTELLPISTYFDAIGDYDMSRAAFYRGYQDFWQKGNDPRMFTALIARLMVYFSRGSDWGNPSTPHGRELIERTYELMPYGEGTTFAWRIYADYLSAHGLPEDARLWKTRAEESQQSGALFTQFVGWTDRWLLLVVAACCAIVVYAFVLYLRYRPQRRLDRAAGQRTLVTRRFAFFNTEYWSQRERIVFFLIVLLGWFSAGMTGQYVAAILRQASFPIGVGAGNFGGPLTIAGFERGLPATPERDLLLAVAYQQDGQLDKAESLYRKLPQFAESWNNLGVILKEAGKDAEAKSAFEKALALDPKLAEAALNLARPPTNFWTEQHQKYLPGKPMIAPPSGSHMDGAFVGGSAAKIFLRGLAGPLSTGNLFGSFGLFRKLVG